MRTPPSQCPLMKEGPKKSKGEENKWIFNRMYCNGVGKDLERTSTVVRQAKIS